MVSSVIVKKNRSDHLVSLQKEESFNNMRKKRTEFLINKLQNFQLPWRAFFQASYKYCAYIDLKILETVKYFKMSFGHTSCD